MRATGNIFKPKRENIKKIRGLQTLATFHQLGCQIMSQSASALHAIPMGNLYRQLLMKQIIPQVLYHMGHVFHAIGIRNIQS